MHHGTHQTKHKEEYVIQAWKTKNEAALTLLFQPPAEPKQQQNAMVSVQIHLRSKVGLNPGPPLHFSPKVMQHC